jgi:hypothetical protein
VIHTDDEFPVEDIVEPFDLDEEVNAVDLDFFNNVDGDLDGTKSISKFSTFSLCLFYTNFYPLMVAVYDEDGIGRSKSSLSVVWTKVPRKRAPMKRLWTETCSDDDEVEGNTNSKSGRFRHELDMHFMQLTKLHFR